MTTQITSAYNFVPLSPNVVQPDWQDLVSHDVPLQDGLCAELEVELQAHTPLLVGKERAETGPKTPVEFYRYPDGTYAIPGSSIRGMLRNVLEIATFARLAPVMDDRALSLRDLHLPAYRNELAKSSPNGYEAKSRGGWLAFDASTQQWKIKECEVYRIFHEDLTHKPANDKSMHELLAAASYNEKDSDAQRMAQLKYKAVNNQVGYYFSGDQTPQTYKHSNGDLYYKRVKMAKKETGQPGYLIFTGQPGKIEGPKDKHRPGNKHIEFVFGLLPKATHQIQADVVRTFQQIYENSSDLKFLSGPDSPHKKRGIPVFFLVERQGDNESVTSMGLSQMYRLPGEKTLGAIAREQQSKSGDIARLDFVETLFGQARVEKNALKGRVQFGDFVFSGPSNPKSPPLAGPDYSKQTVLAAPKPSFYPSYFEQNANMSSSTRPVYKSILSKDAKLRGWKRYPVRPLGAIALVEPPAQNAASNSVLKPLADGARFKGKIRMHNVTRIEAGALLWALDFGDSSGELRHALGMGKPFGFGQVSLKLTQAAVFRPNCPGQAAPDRQMLVDEFVAYMDQKCSGWLQSAQITELQAMADPRRARKENLIPLKLAVGDRQGNAFASAKTAGATLKRYTEMSR